jgi:hypothetical protein
MSTHTHSAWICEAALVRAVREAVTLSVSCRDGGPLRAFFDAHRDVRERAQDSGQTALDRKVVARAVESLRSLKHRDDGLRDRLRELSETASKLSLDARQVSHTAQHTLLGRTKRLVELVRMHAPVDAIAHDIERAQAAVDALDTADLHARLRAAGILTEPLDFELVESCLALCRAPLHDEDVGIGEDDGSGCVGSPLVSTTITPIDEMNPPDDLFARAIERFGMFDPSQARELLIEDYTKFFGSFSFYAEPTLVGWSEGEDLRELARSFDSPNARRFSRALTFAADHEYGVVDWTVRT